MIEHRVKENVMLEKNLFGNYKHLKKKEHDSNSFNIGVEKSRVKVVVSIVKKVLNKGRCRIHKEVLSD